MKHSWFPRLDFFQQFQLVTLISSNTLVGHPATVYQKGMILFLGSLTLPIVLIFVARVIVPFYRNAVGMSAYEYLGARFGIGGRLYASSCFIADRLFDVGVTMLTTAVPVCVVAGWSLEENLQQVILVFAAFTVIYTVIGTDMTDPSYTSTMRCICIG